MESEIRATDETRIGPWNPVLQDLEGDRELVWVAPKQVAGHPGFLLVGRLVAGRVHENVSIQELHAGTAPRGSVGLPMDRVEEDGPPIRQGTSISRHGVVFQ